MKFEKVRVGFPIYKKSIEVIEEIQDSIMIFAKQEKIKLSIEKDLHMTLDYLPQVTPEELIKKQTILYQEKELFKGHPLYVPEQSFDETLHKLEVWKSNVSEEIFVVLVPHNPKTIYKDIIQNPNIGPHTSIAKIEQNISPETLATLEKYLKEERKKYIKGNFVIPDLKKLFIKM